MDPMKDELFEIVCNTPSHILERNEGSGRARGPNAESFK